MEQVAGEEQVVPWPCKDRLEPHVVTNHKHTLPSYYVHNQEIKPYPPGTTLEEVVDDRLLDEDSSFIIADLGTVREQIQLFKQHMPGIEFSFCAFILVHDVALTLLP